MGNRSLAWQKGQGVPQRYRKAQDQYQALLLEIEMTERSFLDAEHTSYMDEHGAIIKLDPRAEKMRLQKLFETARADQQANYPDLYVSTAGSGSGSTSKDPAKEKEVQPKEATVPKEAVGVAVKDPAKELEAAKAETESVKAELMAKIEALVKQQGAKVEEKVGEAMISSAAKI
jgi:hypothetical protein